MCSPPAEPRLRLSEALFAIEPALKLGFRSRGITYARLRLLSALRHGGPRRLLDLGSELGVTARNFTGRVDALERHGLAERLPHPNGRPAIVVRLTPAGDRLAGELLTEQRAALAELLASFPRPTSATCCRP
jgi:DNA-binding MarR family transcriptional regulator